MASMFVCWLIWLWSISIFKTNLKRLKMIEGSKSVTTTEQLLRSAYKCLVDNCVYEQNSVAHINGILMIEAIGQFLKIEPTELVKEALEAVNVG